MAQNNEDTQESTAAAFTLDEQIAQAAAAFEAARNELLAQESK